MYIKETFRKMGVGKRLIAEAFSFARKMKVEFVVAPAGHLRALGQFKDDGWPGLRDLLLKRFRKADAVCPEI